MAHCDWKGTQVTLIDAPGFQDFAGEVACALAGADAAVLVVSANGTVPVGAELAWEMITAAGLPCLFVVNRMDRENAAYEPTVDALREAFGRKPIAVVAPIGAAEALRGYVDLVDGSAHLFGTDGGATPTDLPSGMGAEVARARTALADAAAETDDSLIEKYLEGTELSAEEIRGALHRGTAAGTLVPVICAAAADSRGAALVLDSIVELPSLTHGTDPQGHRRLRQGGRDPLRPRRAPGGAGLPNLRGQLRQGLLRPDPARDPAGRDPPVQRDPQERGALRPARPPHGQAGGDRR